MKNKAFATFFFFFFFKLTKPNGLFGLREKEGK